MGNYWLHGVMNWIQSLYLFAIMGGYAAGGSTGEMIFAAVVAGMNFIVHFPSAIIWTLTTTDKSDTPIYRHYARALLASIIIGWF